MSILYNNSIMMAASQPGLTTKITGNLEWRRGKKYDSPDNGRGGSK